MEGAGEFKAERSGHIESKNPELHFSRLRDPSPEDIDAIAELPTDMLAEGRDGDELRDLSTMVQSGIAYVVRNAEDAIVGFLFFEKHGDALKLTHMRRADDTELTAELMHELLEELHQRGYEHLETEKTHESGQLFEELGMRGDSEEGGTKFERAL